MDQRATSIFEILDARLALALDDFSAVLQKHDIDEVVHYTMYRPNVPKAEAPSSQAPVVAAEAKPQGLEALGAKAAGLDKTAKKKGAAEKTGAASPKGTKEKKAPAAAKAPKHRGIVTANVKKAAPAPAPQKATPAPVPPKAAPAPAPQKAAPEVKKPKIAKMGKWAPPGTRHPAGLAIDVGMLHKKDGTWLSVAANFQGQIGEKTCGEGARVPEQAPGRELRALVCESQAEHIFTYVLTPNYDVAHADHFHMEIKPGVFWFLTH